jgi:hypothetical protein
MGEPRTAAPNLSYATLPLAYLHLQRATSSLNHSLPRQVIFVLG